MPQDRYYLVEVKQIKKKRIFPFDHTVNNPESAFKLLQYLISNKDREMLCAIGFDSKGKITYFEVVHIGTLSQSMIHPREVFKSTILSNSNAIIIAHNHPSGDVEPSQADRIATKKIFEAGEIMGINVIDHLIIAEDRYHSIKENKTYYGGI